MKILKSVSSNETFLSKNDSKTYDDVKNNKIVITENDKHFSKTDEPFSFLNQKQEKSNYDEFETVIPSTISDVLSFSDYSSYNSEYLNSTQLIHLKKSIPFKYIEYEEVTEESESEETIEDEDFSFLKEDNEYDENVVLKTDFNFKQCFFGRYANIDYGNPTEKISQILEKSSVSNIMNNQSKIEDSMIRMFSYKKDVFPDYRLHSIGTKMSQQYNKQNLSSNELI